MPPMTASDCNLLTLLPHRPPFRFLTRILEMAPSQSGQAVWSVMGDEAFLTGHFPGNPIVPGVLIIEALAQLSGLVGALHAPSSTVAAAAGIAPLPSVRFPQGKLAHADVRFRDAVSPPAEILLLSRLTRTFGALRQFDVQAKSGEQTTAQGHLTLAFSAIPHVAGAREEP